MAKGKISAQQLKHDPLMDQYVKSSEWVRERRQSLMTWLAIAALLLVGFFGVRWYLNNQANKAAAALSEAFAWNNAIVQDPLPPARAGQKAVRTEEEKHRKAFEAFEQAVSYHSDLARYNGALHQLYFDPTKAEATLKTIAEGSSGVSSQARLALAERYRTTGKFNEALAEYKKLKDKPGDVAALLIDFGMAQTHQAMGQKQEAVDIYFNIAKESAKTNIGTKALTELTKLDPARVDQLPAEESKNPFSSRSLSLSQ